MACNTGSRQQQAGQAFAQAAGALSVSRAAQRFRGPRTNARPFFVSNCAAALDIYRLIAIKIGLKIILQFSQAPITGDS
jgi:hypothetical protein